MLPTANVAGYVLVRVGVAIRKIDEKKALKSFEYLSEIGEIDELVKYTPIDFPNKR